MECNDGREDLNKTFYDWIENLENLCDKSKSSSEPSSDGEWQTLDRITPIISMMGSDIIARAKSKGWSEHDLRRHLERLLRRLKDFDWIIRSGFSSDILNDKYLWWHLNITELYKTTSIEQRRSFTNKLPDMRRYIAAYLSEPTLHYPYLDWLLLDAITACGLVVCMESFLEHKHGMAYATCGANYWKLLLFKSLYYPLTRALRWGGPGLLAWWISGYSLVGGLTTAALLYGLNTLLLIRWVLAKLKFALSKKPSFEAIVDEQFSTYQTLKGPVLHEPTIRAAFDRAVAKGIRNQEALCILDRIAANPPPVWTS